MSSRIRLGEPSPNVPGRGRAYLYVLPCRDEDILKIGFSRHPLDRFQTLHRRYFDFFDLARAFLVETDYVRDARDLERRVGGNVKAHRAPSPLVIPRAAAGHGEWFRGAYEIVAADLTSITEVSGFLNHSPVNCWVRDRLFERRDQLFEWTMRLLNAIEAGQSSLENSDTAALEKTLRDVLDAYDAAQLSPQHFISDAVWNWHTLRLNKRPS